MKKQKRVKEYHILLNQILGSGSFAKTYKSYHDKNKQVIYACKVINKQDIKQSYQNLQYVINRIQDQFSVLQSLKHQNIIRFEDSQQTSNNIYLFLQFCPDGNLKDYIDLHRFSHFHQEELSFIRQIIQGCSYLEQKDIVHRDIKPQNILIKNKTIKIADFGLAKVLNTQDSYCSTIVGTIHYMAPEILKQSKVKQTKKCDVWSVGVTIYELITGYLPFEMSQKMQSPHKILQLLQKKKQQNWQQIKNPLLRTLIYKMLVINPADRITFKYALQIISNFTQQKINKISSQKMEHKVILQRKTTINQANKFQF